MRFAVTALFLVSLATGGIYLAWLADEARDAFFDYSMAGGPRGPDAADGQPKYRDPNYVRVVNACRRASAVATFGFPLLAIEAAWLAAVWKGRPSLRPAVWAAVKGSMRGAACLPVALITALLIAMGWTEFSHKYGTDVDTLLALILGGADIGAVAGGIVGGLRGVARRRAEPGAAPDPARR